MNLLTLIVALAITGLPMPIEAHTKRSQSAKVEFKQQHPCPANGAHTGPCKGYVIDHITPLACSGADAPSNMQWQGVGKVCAARNSRPRPSLLRELIVYLKNNQKESGG